MSASWNIVCSLLDPANTSCLYMYHELFWSVAIEKQLPKPITTKLIGQRVVIASLYQELSQWTISLYVPSRISTRLCRQIKNKTLSIIHFLILYFPQNTAGHIKTNNADSTCVCSRFHSR